MWGAAGAYELPGCRCVWGGLQGPTSCQGAGACVGGCRGLRVARVQVRVWGAAGAYELPGCRCVCGGLQGPTSCQGAGACVGGCSLQGVTSCRSCSPVSTPSPGLITPLLLPARLPGPAPDLLAPATPLAPGRTPYTPGPRPYPLHPVPPPPPHLTPHPPSSDPSCSGPTTWSSLRCGSTTSWRTPCPPSATGTPLTGLAGPSSQSSRSSSHGRTSGRCHAHMRPAYGSLLA